MLVLPPKQSILPELKLKVSRFGSVIVIVVLPVQLFASLILMVYVPALTVKRLDDWYVPLFN